MTRFVYDDDAYALVCRGCGESWDYGRVDEIDSWRYCPYCGECISSVDRMPDDGGFDEIVADMKRGK